MIEHPAVDRGGGHRQAGPGAHRTGKGLRGALLVYRPGAELAEELQQYVRKRLSAHSYPREVEFVDELPQTPQRQDPALPPAQPGCL